MAKLSRTEMDELLQSDAIASQLARSEAMPTGMISAEDHYKDGSRGETDFDNHTLL